MQEFFQHKLKEKDPELHKALDLEYGRQLEHLELIASENYTSLACLQAMGSTLTNKYAEGYPGKRYYGGCEYVDQAEHLARERGKKLFSIGDFTPHINVQSHSGAQANQAVFLALLKPGDRILSCELSHGGHLTHGSPVNLSGKWFDIKHYGVSKETECFDYEEISKSANEFKPKLIITGCSAYPREIDFKKFKAIADECGALLMVDMAHIAGLVATDEHPSPFPHADVVTSTTHKTLRGPRGGMILCQPELGKKIDSAVFPGLQGGPLMHVIAAKAMMMKEALEPSFKDYIKKVKSNANYFASCLEEKGFRIIAGGTDTHLILVDLQNKNVTGKDAELALDAAAINANRNTIPFDKASPFVTSGMRLGTPAITTRGMGEAEIKKIADWIETAIQAREDQAKLKEIRSQVKELCRSFPIYPGTYS